jgi:hypothetical protein
MVKTQTTFDRTTFDPARLGNPELVRLRKERSLRKRAALLGFWFQPAQAGAASWQSSSS